VDEDARSRASAELRSAVDRSPVPVLVPPDGDWLAGSVLIVKEHWYALSATRDGLSLALRGTRFAHRHPDIAPQVGRHRVRGQPAFATSDRRIVSVSWQEYGAAYSLDLECAAPDDARCAAPAHVFQLADRLVFVGGDRDSTSEADREVPR
jgi:hypothetical protein